jgi:hypothetical protein
MLPLFSLFIQLSFDPRHPSSGREKAQLPVRLLGRQRTALVWIVLGRALTAGPNREDYARIRHQQHQRQGLA